MCTCACGLFMSLIRDYCNDDKNLGIEFGKYIFFEEKCKFKMRWIFFLLYIYLLKL